MNVDETIAYLYARAETFSNLGNTKRAAEYLRVAESFDNFFKEKERNAS